MRERPSPYKLALCVLIKFYTQPLLNSECDDALASCSSSLIHNFAKFIRAEVKASDRGGARSLNGLVDALQDSVGIGGEYLIDALEHASQSPDDLLQLIISLRELLLPPEAASLRAETSLRPTHIGPSSPLGLFMRRLLLAVNMTHFTALSRLFDHLQLYLQSDSSGASLLVTDGWREQRLSDMAQRLERNIGRISFDEMDGRIQELINLDPTLPKAYWLRCLNCAHHRDHHGAVDALHRYFNYAARWGGPEGSAALAEAIGERGNSPMVAQYGVLNLAVLHWQSGFFESAALALDETVRIAHQHKDHLAIALALSWLHRVMATVHHPQAMGVLERCANRCAALGLHNLEAVTSLSTAAALAHFPAALRSVDALTPSFGLAGMTSHTGSLATDDGGPHELALFSRIDAAASAGSSMIGPKRTLVYASVAAARGEPRLALLSAISVLKSDHTTSSDLCLAMGLAAVAAAHLPDNNTSGSSRRCSTSSVTRTGVESGLVALRRLRQCYPTAFATPYWASATVALVHQIALSRNHLLDSSHHLTVLRSASPLVLGIEQHLSSLTVMVRQLCAEESFSRAVGLSRRLQRAAMNKGLRSSAAQLLLVEAETLQTCCSLSPMQVVTPLLTCLAVTAEPSPLSTHATPVGCPDALHAMATVRLAEMYLSLLDTRSVSVAIALILGALPKLMEQAGAAHRGHALLLLAKCYLTQDHNAVNKPVSHAHSRTRRPHRRHRKAAEECRSPGSAGKGLERCLKALHAAAKYLKHDLQSLSECYYLEARAYDSLLPTSENIRKRDAAAARFLDTSEAV